MQEEGSMLRALVPVLLVALASAQSAQFKSGSPADDSVPTPSGMKSIKPADPAPVAPKPAGGVSAVPKPSPIMLDAAKVAALRARHELAKANGQLCPIREARQAMRLAEAEAQLAAQAGGKGGDPFGLKGKGSGGVQAIGNGKD
jgi:hypothetical protein